MHNHNMHRSRKCRVSSDTVGSVNEPQKPLRLRHANSRRGYIERYLAHELPPMTTTANILDGLIQFAIALFFLCVALGINPFGDNVNAVAVRDRAPIFFWWTGFASLTLFAIAKTFGLV